MWLACFSDVQNSCVYVVFVFPPLVDVITSTYTNMQCLAWALSLNSPSDSVPGTEGRYRYRLVLSWKGSHSPLKSACFGYSRHPTKN